MLGGDAAIRWQVMEQLLDRAPSTVNRERARVARTGWGRDLLDRQDAVGTWAGGIYGPKWTSTTYTLLLLHWMGLPATNTAARRACAHLWDTVDVIGGVSLPRASYAPDICISAMWLKLGAYFGHNDDRMPDVVDWVLDNQLDDGGWNCQAVNTGSTHGSYHTSILVLEALAQLNDRELHDSAARGREFFLNHRLYRSHRTGAVSHPAYTMLSFPPRWHYDVLRGLDYFRSVGAPRDERLDDAVQLIRGKQRSDGRWPVQNKHGGRVWFDMETGRKPSRWNTLRALRVLRWVEPARETTEA